MIKSHRKQRSIYHIIFYLLILIVPIRPLWNTQRCSIQSYFFLSFSFLNKDAYLVDRFELLLLLFVTQGAFHGPDTARRKVEKTFLIGFKLCLGSRKIMWQINESTLFYCLLMFIFAKFHQNLISSPSWMKVHWMQWWRNFSRTTRNGANTWTRKVIFGCHQYLKKFNSVNYCIQAYIFLFGGRLQTWDLCQSASVTSSIMYAFITNT